MQISKETIRILKNFSDINTGITIKSGNEIKTIAEMKNVSSRATISETFEKEFSIGDLREFLNVINSDTFKDGKFSFGETSVEIVKDNSCVNYVYADPSTVTSPTKEMKFPETDIEFTLTKSDLETILHMNKIFTRTQFDCCPDLKVSNSDGRINLSVLDKKNKTSNVVSLDVGESNGHNFEMYFKIEYLKLIKGDYDVKISKEGISHFKHKEIDLEYWIALEPGGTYEAEHHKKHVSESKSEEITDTK